MGDTKIYNIDSIGTAQFVYQSLDYQALTKQIEEKQEFVEYLQATGKTDRALQAGAELEQLEQQLEQFKENVLRLYETFTKIEINSERLAQAKAHFDQGEFREADAILNAEDMARDLEQLIARDGQLDQEKAEVAKNRAQLANEYVIKARLWATFYDQPNRFEQACGYFEEALRAAHTPEIGFEYALFLQEHNCFNQAKLLYEEALHIRRELAEENPRTYLPDVAHTLNNLAILQKAQNEYGAAQGNYEEALQVYRELAEENPRTYLLDVAMTLNNLALLQKAQNEYGAAQGNYEKALHIRRELAEENPRTYLPDVANVLNNLANLQKAQNEYGAAQGNYEEALHIRRELAEENPRTYLPYVAMTLINLSIFYLQAKPDPKKSVAMAMEVVTIASEFPQIPMVARYAEAAHQVLAAHGIDEPGNPMPPAS
ncbi:tetratricopeptide repeat protein [Leptothoe sp. PORK10 BA2]|uniref:tetratricopeptide repeat protein n=1 Tax=Leptothoe sp. PORK10 BA2 TaxID=3110254 RepID=UPI002B21807D|nr:tetratricopeptide repeat protein [Leptothoe sp. PORK10 BA2]MEA5462413.1 tetratricopeptide repeat protein [Leptothoe sp. PORK10 BA2]